MLVHELFTQNFWKDHPLGKPILGTTEPSASSTSKSSSTTTAAASTAATWSSPQPAISTTTSLSRPFADKFTALPPARPLHELQAPAASARILLRNKKSLEQVQICLGVPAPPITDDNRYATLILNTVLGGGMSSRLFQTIREERGMAYSIYSDLSPYRDTGTLCVYAGTSAGKALEVVDLILAEFRKLKEIAARRRRTDSRQGPAQGQHPDGP